MIAKLGLHTENHNEWEGICSLCKHCLFSSSFFSPHVAFFCCGNTKLNMPYKKSCEES